MEEKITGIEATEAVTLMLRAECDGCTFFGAGSLI